MKSNFKYSIFHILALGFALVGPSSAQSDSHPAAPEKENYEVRMSKARDLHREQLQTLGKHYTAALENSATSYQEQGDLDGLVAVKTELENFTKNGVVPSQITHGVHPTISKLRKIFNESRVKADTLKSRTTTKLTASYLTYLQKRQKELTQSGQIEKALLVKAEVTRIQKVKNELPAITPSSRPKPNAFHKNPPGLLLAWNKRIAPDYKLSHGGGNSTSNDGSLSLAGGRTTIEGIENKLLTSCKASNAWSLVLHFATASLDQSGPARIISSSLSGYLRNFSLCQEKDQLVLRLRTTKTGENGTNPEVKLGKIQKGKIHRIALTYQPGKLAFYLDGNAMPVKQISGDLSNWQEFPFVIGNEWKDDRPWKGTLHQFSIYSSALTEKESIAHTK